LSAEINHKNSVNQFNQWPENDGMHSWEKITVQQQLKKKDNENQQLIRDNELWWERNAQNKVLIVEVKGLHNKLVGLRGWKKY
jgi:hypothetical protein